MVGALLAVGAGNLSLDVIAQKLALGKTQLPGMLCATVLCIMLLPSPTMACAACYCLRQQSLQLHIMLSCNLHASCILISSASRLYTIYVCSSHKLSGIARMCAMTTVLMPVGMSALTLQAQPCCRLTAWLSR